jgi:hypothetical protein
MKTVDVWYLKKAQENKHWVCVVFDDEGFVSKLHLYDKYDDIVIHPMMAIVNLRVILQDVAEEDIPTQPLVEDVD